MKALLAIKIFPLVALLCVGYLVGNLFEPLWLRLITGFPAGMVAYFFYRNWGKSLHR